VTLTANFDPNPPETFTLNVIGAEGGVISGTLSGAYTEGFAVQVTATASIGYRFTGWTITGASITGGSNANPAAFLMPENTVTLTAIFEEISEIEPTPTPPPHAGSPQTGTNRNTMMPIILMALGAILITGAELYRRGFMKRTR